MFASFLHDCLTRRAFGRFPLPLLGLLIAPAPGLVRVATGQPGVAFLGVQGTVAIGLGIPHGTAVDTAGNVYVTDLLNSKVFKVRRSATVPNCMVSSSCTQVGSGFVQPTAIAVDKSGNLYVVDGATQALYKVAANGGQTTLAAGLAQPAGVAVAVDGTVYVAVSGSITRVTAAGAVSTLAAGPTEPGGIALGSDGDLYVADAGGNRVLAINRAGVQSVVAIGMSTPQAVALDGAQNLYIADTGNSRILSLPSSSVAAVCPLDCTISAEHINSPGGVSADVNGSLYIADTGNQQVVKLAQDADFGAAAVNASGSTPLTLTYQLFGSSCAAPPIVHVVTRGNAGKDFIYNPAENVCTPGVTDSLSVTVRFAPLSPGLRKGAVQLVDSTGIPQVGTYLHGIGSCPQITWTPGVVSTVLANPSPASP